jgi:hypothetical protein
VHDFFSPPKKPLYLFFPQRQMFGNRKRANGWWFDDYHPKLNPAGAVPWVLAVVVLASCIDGLKLVLGNVREIRTSFEAIIGKLTASGENGETLTTMEQGLCEMMLMGDASKKVKKSAKKKTNKKKKKPVTRKRRKTDNNRDAEEEEEEDDAENDDGCDEDAIVDGDDGLPDAVVNHLRTLTVSDVKMQFPPQFVKAMWACIGHKAAATDDAATSQQPRWQTLSDNQKDNLVTELLLLHGRGVLTLGNHIKKIQMLPKWLCGLIEHIATIFEKKSPNMEAIAEFLGQRENPIMVWFTDHPAADDDATTTTAAVERVAEPSKEKTEEDEETQHEQQQRLTTTQFLTLCKERHIQDGFDNVVIRSIFDPPGLSTDAFFYLGLRDSLVGNLDISTTKLLTLISNLGDWTVVDRFLCTCITPDLDWLAGTELHAVCQDIITRTKANGQTPPERKRRKKTNTKQ